jgi:hypothetical protein
MAELRPSITEYERIDGNLNENNYPEINNHVIHGPLSGKGKIEVYEVYKKIGSDECMCIVKFGGSLNGYPGSNTNTALDYFWLNIFYIRYSSWRYNSTYVG